MERARVQKLWLKHPWDPAGDDGPGLLEGLLPRGCCFFLRRLGGMGGGPVPQIDTKIFGSVRKPSLASESAKSGSSFKRVAILSMEGYV